MSRVTRTAPHLSETEIAERIGRTRGFWRVQRWLAIRHGLVEPAPAGAIARRVGLATQTVHHLISRYNRIGPEAVESPGRGQRQRAYAGLQEESAFLEAYRARAVVGEAMTVHEIKAAWERHIGHPVHKTTIYRLLRRHGWRKLAPRPSQVKSDPGAQEAFKKTPANGPRPLEHAPIHGAAGGHICPG